MNNITETIVTIAVAIIGLAMVAVLVSKNAQTTGVISAGGNAFNSALATAISPVTGNSGGNGLNAFTGRIFG